jgi:type I restriction-modification system DNA methylase subunit
MNKKETFTQIMDQLARRHGIHNLFSDFLTLLICAFSHGAKEEEYLNTIGKYEKPDAYKFSDALGALVIEMTGDGDGMVDVLGKYFEENLSFGKNGQFFTPQHLCDLMARITNPVQVDNTNPRILDPACGSGRTLGCSQSKPLCPVLWSRHRPQLCNDVLYKPLPKQHVWRSGLDG